MLHNKKGYSFGVSFFVISGKNFCTFLAHLCNFCIFADEKNEILGCFAAN